jgi:hypothetical protein
MQDLPGRLTRDELCVAARLDTPIAGTKALVAGKVSTRLLLAIYGCSSGALTRGSPVTFLRCFSIALPA